MNCILSFQGQRQGDCCARCYIFTVYSSFFHFSSFDFSHKFIWLIVWQIYLALSLTLLSSSQEIQGWNLVETRTILTGEFLFF
jgi:hypothetical protein